MMSKSKHTSPLVSNVVSDYTTMDFVRLPFPIILFPSYLLYIILKWSLVVIKFNLNCVSNPACFHTMQIAETEETAFPF